MTAQVRTMSVDQAVPGTPPLAHLVAEAEVGQSFA